MKIGAQLYTVRHACKDLDSFAETLKRVADMGYTTVQVSGTCDYEAEWLAEQLKACWTQIAEEFKGYDERLIFEGMNEPRWKGTEWEWNGGNDEGRADQGKRGSVKFLFVVAFDECENKGSDKCKHRADHRAARATEYYHSKKKTAEKKEDRAAFFTSGKVECKGDRHAYDRANIVVTAPTGGNVVAYDGAVYNDVVGNIEPDDLSRNHNPHNKADPSKVIKIELLPFHRGRENEVKQKDRCKLNKGG